MLPIEAFMMGLFIGAVLGGWVVAMGMMAGFDEQGRQGAKEDEVFDD